MTITEFAKSRNQQPQTISRYISRHEEFEGHTKKVGKNVELDDIAIAYLDEVYPLPKPVHVINGVPQEEYDELRTKYEELLEKARELDKYLLDYEKQKADIKIAQARIEAENSAQKLLLEDKQEQIEKAENRADTERNRADKERDRADQATQELSKYHKSIFGLYRKDK